MVIHFVLVDLPRPVELVGYASVNLTMNEEIPESFYQSLRDCAEGRLYPLGVVMSLKSEDYNEGYRDGFNQCLKDQKTKAAKRLKL